jgi:hypothetical protein
MLSKTRQTLTRTVFGSNLAGDGMLVRLRSTSIALLGVVTAIGLGLVAFISQLGWPGIVNSPIPNGPAEAGSIHSAIALTRGRTVVSASSPQGARAPQVVAASPLRTQALPVPATAPADSGLGGSQRIGVAAGGQPSDAGAQPLPVPVSTPIVEPAATSPVPVTPPAPVSAVVEPPQSSSVTPSQDPKPIKSTVDPKPSGPSTTKVDGNGESKPDAPSLEKPKCHGGGQGKDYPTPSTPTSDPPGASDSFEAPPPVVVASPTAPPIKVAPEVTEEVTGYGSGKEAWDAGKSDERHH